MSDQMLFGVLQMPYEAAINDELSRVQFYACAQQAIARINELKKIEHDLLEIKLAAKDYLLALDQWENSNKAERRVEVAEAWLRATIGK